MIDRTKTISTRMLKFHERLAKREIKVLIWHKNIDALDLINGYNESNY